MPLYICEVCNFQTRLKTDFKRHHKTKKHMYNLKSTKENTCTLVDGEKTLKKMTQNDPKMTQNGQNPPKTMTPNDPKTAKNDHKSEKVLTTNSKDQEIEAMKRQM